MPLNPVETLLLAVLLLVGIAIFLYGARDLRVVYHIVRDDPVDVYTLPNRPGPVEIEGTAREGDDGTVTAPFSGEACLAYEYEAQEMRSSGKHSHWETLAEGGAAVPFFLDDGDARVRVEPAGASLHFEDHVTQVDPGDEPPERIRRFVEATDDVDVQDGAFDIGPLELHLGNQQKFVERRLDVGETVYVYGEAVEERAGGWGSGVVNAVVRRGERTPVFVVSDASERATAWRIVRSALVTAGFGAVFLFFVFLFAVGML